MLKFFKHIRKNLLMENKPGKYIKYAIGEILLVVIGILIALQINNWNEARKEGIEEQKILKALNSDFKYNKVELQQNIKETNQTVVKTNNVLKVFQIDTPIDRKTSDSLINRLFSFSTFHPSDGTLNEVINSGRLKILKNDELRDKLSNWNSLVLDVTEDETYMRNFIDKYIEPVQIESASYVRNSRLSRSSQHWFKNASFENIVAKLNGMARYQVKLYKSLDKEVDEIIALIESSVYD